MDQTTFAPSLAALRRLVYETLAREGRPPSVAECARRLGQSRARIEADLRRLHDRHALVLTPDGDAIRMAHPFSAAPMGFVVSAGDERWWGGCTWDSLGIAAALGRLVEVETVCLGCGTDIRFEAGPRRAPNADVVVRIPRPAAQWWDDVVWTCTRIRSFCTNEHAERYVSTVDEHLGELVPIEVMWRLANVWYGDRLARDYRQRTREASQSLLDGVGLTGEFWRLP